MGTRCGRPARVPPTQNRLHRLVAAPVLLAAAVASAALGDVGRSADAPHPWTAAASTDVPPLTGTVFMEPDVMVPSDRSALLEMTYAGRGQVTPADLVMLPPGGANPPDPGSTAEDSALLPIGPPVAGTILGAADVDVYRIDLQGRATLEVRTSGPTDVRGELLDSTGRLVLSGDDGGPGGHNLRIRADLQAGIYYVAIAGETGDYAVMARLGDAPDHGATAATSTLLTLHAESALGQVSPSALLAAPGRIAPTSADVDVFRLDVPLDGTDVTVRSAGGTDVFGRLLDAGGNELAADAGVGNFRIQAMLDAGIYYVVVTASETGTYRVLASGDSAVCPCEAGSAPDHGGDAEGSTLMPIGPPLPGIIDDPDDVDVFRIDLQGSTTLDVRTSGPTDVHGELFDGAGARIAADDDSGPGGRNFRIRADLEAGVYYVAIAGESGHYAVMARLGHAPDHGDTAATSTRLTLHAREGLDEVSPSALLAAPGRMAPTAADVDVFRLDVPENATDITVRSIGATDVLARLLDSSLNEIVADAAEGNFWLEVRLAAGTYYVEVGGRETGTYRVLAWSDAPCDCAGAEGGRGDPPDKEPPVTPRIGPLTESGSFTDSHGRTLRYGYGLDEGWRRDVPRGVLIYFHGNATFASQDAALDRLLPATRAAAFSHGLVPVAVVSPETRVEGDDSAVRQWLSADRRLIHELLQSHLDRQVSLDLDRVVFTGGSQGTCFLNAFLREYGEHYGGGADVFCGCSSRDSLDPLWTPSKEFADAFRVVVSATTEDFLWHDAVRQYGYYKHTVELETRGDLAAPGGHCRRGDISREATVRWVLGETILPERPPEPRLERVSTLHHIAGLAVDGDGTVWAAQRQPNRDDTKVWRSVDAGATWEAVSVVDMAAGDIDAVDGHLFLTPANPYGSLRAPLRRSSDGGRTFVPVAVDGSFRAEAPLVPDVDGRLYVLGITDADGQDIFESTDSGRTWSALDAPFPPVGEPLIQGGRDRRWWITNSDAILASPPRIIASERISGAWRSRHLLGDPESTDWKPVRDTGRDLRAVAWDGTAAYATAGRPSTWEGNRPPYFTLLRSEDEGGSWNEVELPFEAVPRFSAFAQPYVSVLPEGRPLVHGGMHNPVIRDDAGGWRLVHGGGTVGASGLSGVRPGIAVDRESGRVFVSDGYALFRLDATAAGIYHDDRRTDRDGDGVPDVRDAFPSDPSEYLDTDGDGVGNAGSRRRRRRHAGCRGRGTVRPFRVSRHGRRRSGRRIRLRRRQRPCLRLPRRVSDGRCGEHRHRRGRRWQRRGRGRRRGRRDGPRGRVPAKSARVAGRGRRWHRGQPRSGRRQRRRRRLRGFGPAPRGGGSRPPPTGQLLQHLVRRRRRRLF